MIYSIVTLACLVCLAIEVVYVTIGIFSKSHYDSVTFIRSFKKGKCAFIYLIALPLYFIGHLYSGKMDWLNSIFSAIKEVVNLVVLKYNTSSITALMTDNRLYYVTVYICFALVSVNALLFTMSFVSQRIWLFFHRLAGLLTHRETLIIFGNNKENQAIYRSDKTRYKTVYAKLTDEEAVELYKKEIFFASVSSYEATVEKIFNRGEKRQIIVVNTGDDETNMIICRHIVTEIEKREDKKNLKLFRSLSVFVFGDPRFEDIYEDIVSSGLGCIHYINKYQKIAMDFIDRYPLTYFMDKRQIDYETSLIKKDVDINVIMIGFGKTNRQIFLTSVANNQFLTEGEDGPVLKQVKYHVYDKEEADNNKNLNHNYYRFINECEGVSAEDGDYLPFPAEPAVIIPCYNDINHKNFYKGIRSIVQRNPNDANFIVIAFGSDLENIDMAQKLVEKRREWGVKNLVIFVKARTWHKELSHLDEDNCFFIGNENDTVYDIELIIRDKIFTMSHLRNETYRLEYEITENPDIELTEEYLEEHSDRADKVWYTRLHELQRESNLYCCLSLRSKLNLMGLDYCRIDEKPEAVAMTEEQYLDWYAGRDLPDTSHYKHTANGKKIVKYPLYFNETTRRFNMTVHEHQRWNSYMISKGMVPATKTQIREEYFINKDGEVEYTDGRNYEMRRHGNITTFKGLEEFRRIVAERDNVPEIQKDVIKYDYQILDDAYWLLTKCGYKIYKNGKYEK